MSRFLFSGTGNIIFGALKIGKNNPEITNLEFENHENNFFHVFLPTEQAGTNICSMVYQNINLKICLSLFGWKENILPKEHIVYCWHTRKADIVGRVQVGIQGRRPRVKAVSAVALGNRCNNAFLKSHRKMIPRGPYHTYQRSNQCLPALLRFLWSKHRIHTQSIPSFENPHFLLQDTSY